MRRDFPGIEVVQADHYDLPTLESAVQGMEGMFVNTTLPKDEQTAMRNLMWHNGKVPHMDKRDIAEAAARILLSDNHRHIGQFHTLNNGQDLLNYAQIADLMTQVWGKKITFEGSKDAVINESMASYGPIFPKLWDFFEFEQDNEEVWTLNDFMERTIGRKPISLREWLRENKRELRGLDANQMPTATGQVPEGPAVAAVAGS